MSVREVSIYFKHLLQINYYHLSRRFAELKANSDFLNVYFLDISTRSSSIFGAKVLKKNCHLVQKFNLNNVKINVIYNVKDSAPKADDPRNGVR